MIAIKGLESKLTDGSTVWNVRIEDTEDGQNIIVPAYDQKASEALVLALRKAINVNSPESVDA